MILDMTKYHEEFKNEIRDKIKELRDIPKLHIITDGKDERCKVYMKSKINMCNELGIPCVVDMVSTDVEMNSLCETIEDNYEVSICQLPIDKKLESVYKCSAEYSDIDVDGVFSGNNIFMNDYSVLPATAKGIMRYLHYEYGGKLRGKNIILVGMGELCNKPLMVLFANEGATVMTFNTSTDRQLKEVMLKNADIVVCAGGKKGTVKTSQLADNKKVLVFNVGIVFDANGKLDTELEVDVEKENVDYTPRVKGVGVSTVLSLLDNVVNTGKEKEEDRKYDEFFKDIEV